MPDGSFLNPEHRTIALYREWRPRTFGEVVEQSHVVKTLMNSISHDRIAHAYLFCGTRGSGKTTLAQIMSRAVNCQNIVDSEPCNRCETCEGILANRILDVAEIDAASNNSVDNIRTLRDQINYAPVQTKYKVYIIDEVHMLSGGAFNALLKTLEEPPPYVIFILATTEPHKLPATILSRCQRFDFRRISDGAIAGHLAKISRSIGVTAEDGALRLIAKLSEGAMRDAISIFDQCAPVQVGAPLTLDDVLRITGRPGDEYLIQSARILIGGDVKAVPGHIADVLAAGVGNTQFIDGMTVFFRDMLMIKLGHNRESFPEMSDDVFNEAAGLAMGCDVDYLLTVSSEFSLMANALKGSVNQTVLLEVSLAKLCLRRFRTDNAIESINARLNALERRMEGMFTGGAGAAGGVAAGAGAAAGASAAAGAGVAGSETAETSINRTTTSSTAETTGADTGTLNGALTAKTGTVADAGTVNNALTTKAGTGADTGMMNGVPTDASDTDAVNGAPTVVVDTGEDSGNVDAILWDNIVKKFIVSGNPALYSILQGTKARTIDDNFQILLPPEKAALSGILINPGNISKLRDEIKTATGQAYSIQIVSEKGPFDEMAKAINEKFDIPANVYP